jgi:hypothetical protein
MVLYQFTDCFTKIIRFDGRYFVGIKSDIYSLFPL